jgi:hypothetical protein
MSFCFSLFNRQVRILSMLFFSSLLLIALESTAAATVVIGDTEFDPSDWNTQQIVTTVGSTTVTQVTGGNPGNTRRIQLVLPEPGPNGVGVIQTLQTDSYDPASGEIFSLDFDLDFLNVSSNSGLIVYHAVSLLLLQDGNIYLNKNTGFSTGSDPGWQSSSSPNLVASDFGLLDLGNLGFGGEIFGVDFDSNPDFSGGPIQFGFATLLTDGTPQGTLDTRVAAYDNFSVAVNPVLPVPALGSLAMGLLVALIGGFGVWRGSRA